MFHTVPEAELSCLACFVADNAYLRDTMLEARHFAIQANENMFVIMKALYESGNRVDVFSMADKLGDYDEAAKLMEFAPSVSPTVYRHYEGLVIEAWKRREAIRITGQLRQEIDENLDLSSVPTRIAELQSLDSYGAEDSEPFAESVQKVITELESSDGKVKGVTTGLPTLNAMLYGWQNESLYVVAARPSVGKSAFVLHCLLEAARTGVACNLFALEMSRYENIKRLLADDSHLDGASMRNPRKLLSTAEWSQLTGSADRLKKMAIDICDRAYITIGDIRSRVRKMATKHPGRKQLVVVDYLQLMPVHRKDGRTESQLYGEIAWNLKMLAREYKVPVIAVSQLSRESEKGANKRPLLSHLRSSGEIEQHADCVLLLHRQDYYDPTDKPNVMEVNVAKQRNGPTGTVELIYLRDRQRFEDIPKPQRSEP